jgi:hypothetical protein
MTMKFRSREEQMLQTALALAARGLHVFPCRVADKIPATPHGCLDATVDQGTIRQWWRHEPNFNLAIATGTASKVFAIDIDNEDAEAELRKLETEHGALPPSVEVITARGRHVYFQMPNAPIANSASKLAPGVDVRGTGGYCLSPPSRHPSGKLYSWSVDCAGTFAMAPAWLLDRISASGNKSTPAAEWRDLVLNGADEGTRDCTLARLAGHLLRRRIDPVVVLELLKSWNATHCRSPLPAIDIERVCASIAARELKRRQHDVG